jgi:hypothetical protein
VLPEFDRSFMKVLDEEVDTMTDDYKNNYEQMQKLNHELDEITAGIMDVGDR